MTAGAPTVLFTEAWSWWPFPAGTGEDSSDTATTTRTDHARCWNYGTRSKDATNTTCSHCHESLVPPALLIDFPQGPVVVRTPGTSAELRRAGMYGHVFALYRNVSRWPATVSVDEHGDAWLTPHPAGPNGTFVNGSEIIARTPVRPADQIRLATDRGPNIGPVSERIRRPRLEPDDQRPVRQTADDA